jgi:hypothetical protein
MPGVKPLLACGGSHYALGGDATGALRGRIVGLRKNSTLLHGTAERDRCSECELCDAHNSSGLVGVLLQAHIGIARTHRHHNPKKWSIDPHQFRQRDFFSRIQTRIGISAIGRMIVYTPLT